MELKEFKEKADLIIDEFQQLIEELPQKGDKSADCQRVCLQIHLGELESAVNGTTASDMGVDTHTCLECGWEGTEDDLQVTTDLSQKEVQYGKCCPECRSEEVEEL